MTKYLKKVYNARKQNERNCIINMGAGVLKKVKEFIYLGSVLCKNVSHNILHYKNIICNTKLRFCK